MGPCAAFLLLCDHRQCAASLWLSAPAGEISYLHLLLRVMWDSEERYSGFKGSFRDEHGLEDLWVP